MAHQALTAGVGERNVPNRITGADGTMNKRSAVAIVPSLAAPDTSSLPHCAQSIHRPNSSSTKRTTAAFRMSSLLVLSLLLLSAPTSIHAQDDDVCSCSPREYVFKLDLSATCPPNPPPFPPNDVFGPGVSDYTCAISPEPSSTKDNLYDEQVRRLFGEETMQNDDDSANVDDFVVPTIIDPEPVVINSIQFFESDIDFNVINQDPSYVRDISFVNGDIFNYTSISDLITTSSKQNNKIPGGISMVLRGRNAAGERVRNTFSIRFTNECGIPTFEVGEAIGWVIFESFVPASKETCRSVQGSLVPTPSPSYGVTSGTASPFYGVISVQPTESTPSPVAENTPSPSFGDDITSGKPNETTPSPAAESTPEPSGYGPRKPTRRPTPPTQSKPTPALSYDFNVVYSKFEPEPKADKMESPVELSYQFYQPDVGAKANKGGKSSNSSGGKSGKSSGKSSKSSSSSSVKSGKSARVRDFRKSKDEPVRGLRATLSRMDLDHEAKLSNTRR